MGLNTYVENQLEWKLHMGDMAYLLVGNGSEFSHNQHEVLHGDDQFVEDVDTGGSGPFTRSPTLSVVVVVVHGISAVIVLQRLRAHY